MTQELSRLLLVILAITWLSGCSSTSDGGGSEPEADASAADTVAEDGAAPTDATTPPDEVAQGAEVAAGDTQSTDVTVEPHFPVTTHGHTFTTSTCLEGTDWLQGTWRYFEELEWDEAANGYLVVAPAEDEYVEILEIEGSTFTNVLVGDDLGEWIDATIVGWYLCADGSELSTQQTVFFLEAVDPDGAFGNATGDAWPCDLMGDETGFLMACNFEWAPSNPWSGQYEYARCKDAACTHVF